MPLDYMQFKQTDITHSMRSILVDWLVEVAEEYVLLPQTLYLAVQLIDRLLCQIIVNRTKLQLVGITAILIAAKYEEIYPPSVDQLVYISDSTYTREEVLKTETLLLTTLRFNVSQPTPWEFSKRFSRAAMLDPKSECLCNFIMEACLQQPMYLRHKASHIAAIAVFLALHNRGWHPWPPALERASGYRIFQLHKCLRDAYLVHVRASGFLDQLPGGRNGKYAVPCSGLKALKEKYADDKHMNVSNIVPALLNIE
jgi:hypothetical protein